jgi:nitroreductase
MEFSELMKLRHSCRNYSDEQIEPEILDEIIEAGRIAPSAQNKQPWRYVIVNDKELIKKIAFHSIVGTVNYFIKDAPIIVLACADTKSALKFNGQEYYLVDVAISFSQMMLAGWNRGIGSCWLAAFDEVALKKLLNLPEHIRIVGLSPFGYPKDKNFYAKIVSFVAGSHSRKDKKEILIYINEEK